MRSCYWYFQGDTKMTSNGILPDATKKHKTSRSLWSSLPVTALLRGQQEKDGFLLAAQGPNLLLLPWDGGEPHERLQVQ